MTARLSDYPPDERAAIKAAIAARKAAQGRITERAAALASAAPPLDEVTARRLAPLFRLDDATPAQRRLLLALIDAAKPPSDL